MFIYFKDNILNIIISIITNTITIQFKGDTKNISSIYISCQKLTLIVMVTFDFLIQLYLLPELKKNRKNRYGRIFAERLRCDPNFSSSVQLTRTSQLVHQKDKQYEQ